MSELDQPPPRSWYREFHDAIRGIAVAIRDHNSFVVHLALAVGVVGLAVLLPLSHGESCVLFLCIVLVITAELFNTSLEQLAKAVDREFNPFLRDALDISS